MNNRTQYRILTGLQIRMALSGLLHRKDFRQGKAKKGNMSKTLGLFIAYAVLGGFVMYLELKVMNVAIKLHMPQVLMQLAAFAATMLSLLYCLAQGILALYFRKDIENYAPLPVNSRALYLSQLTMLVLPECAVTALILLPMAGIFMARVGFNLRFALTALALTVLIPLVPAALGALVGGGIASLPAFRRHREGLATGVSAAVMIISVALNYAMGQFGGNMAGDPAAMETLFTGRESLIGRVTGAFPPADWAARALMGESVNLLYLLGTGLALGAAAVWLFGKQYIAVASSDQEASARVRRQEGYRLKGQEGALWQLEWRQVVRTPVYLMNCAVSSLMMPILMTGGIAIGFMNAGEDLYTALTELAGDIDLTVLAVGSTFIFSFMGGMNTACATAVSREGRRHGIYAALPVPAIKILRAKVLSGFILSALGLIVPTAALIILMPLLWGQAVKAFVWSLGLNFAFACTAVTLDALKPKLDWHNETEAVKQNFNQIYSMLVGFACLGALGLMTWAIIQNGLDGLTWYFTGALIALCAAAWLMLKTVAVRAYTKCEE